MGSKNNPIIRSRDIIIIYKNFIDLSSEALVTITILLIGIFLVVNLVNN